MYWPHLIVEWWDINLVTSWPYLRLDRWNIHLVTSWPHLKVDWWDVHDLTSGHLSNESSHRFGYDRDPMSNWQGYLINTCYDYCGHSASIFLWIIYLLHMMMRPLMIDYENFDKFSIDVNMLLLLLLCCAPGGFWVATVYPWEHHPYWEYVSYSVFCVFRGEPWHEYT